MSETVKRQHTPGPWRWEGRDTPDYYEGPLERLIGGDGEVMSFGDNTQYYPSAGSGPNDENADLIAACRLARRELHHIVNVLGRRGGLYEEALRECEAAIGKAEGGAL